MGARTLDEIVGRSDLLERAEHPELPRAALLDLSLLLAPPARADEPRRRTQARNDRPNLVSLDELFLPEVLPALERGRAFRGHYPIRNHHLTVGARLAGIIAERHGDAGLPPDSVHLEFTGSAGQSFGAFAVRGMRLDLEGEANDYVGKGLSGGVISVRPFAHAGYGRATHNNLIIGNTSLYGATGGTLFAAGQAGDRFAVRNSGAVAVIEGAGNHCCEYMTGGIVAVLGRTGRNFGAGMSNGLAYVLDEEHAFASRVNHEMVLLAEPGPADDELLHLMVRQHLESTGSPRAQALLAEWPRARALFRRVEPRGAEPHVAAIRDAYLLAHAAEPARMTA
jgi:glutamate synthase domain-containing protein 3